MGEDDKCSEKSQGNFLKVGFTATLIICTHRPS